MVVLVLVVVGALQRFDGGLTWGQALQDCHQVASFATTICITVTG